MAACPTASFHAAYSAQAAEILLDAIARSHGTRESVTRELLQATIEDGILGDIDFDKNGDPVEAPVTIYRVVGKGHLGLGVDSVLMALSSIG